MTEHRAFTAHSPWAWALIWGGKNVENRSPSFGKKYLGDVWVHCSKGRWGGQNGVKRKAEVMLETLWESLEWMCFEDYDFRIHAHALVKKTMAEKWGSPSFPPRKENLLAIRGHIIGRVTIIGYRMPDNPPESNWYVPSSMAVMVENPRPLAEPIPAKGGLGLWRPDADLIAQLEAAA